MIGTEEQLERDVLDAVMRQLGPSFVSLVLEGSRATGDVREDSDFDAQAFYRGEQRLEFEGQAELENRFGVRVGVVILPIDAFQHWVRGEKDAIADRNNLRLIGMKLGQAKVIGGQDIISRIPPVEELMKRDLSGELKAEIRWATAEDSPSNVFRREPRRHVGFIIAICNLLLLSKGVAVRKANLPDALAKHHPKFPAVELLRRALKRREEWNKIGGDSKFQRQTLADLRDFLDLYHKYLNI